jgi:hypothetical protein
VTRRLVAAAGAALGLACSTLARTDKVSCTKDDDCVEPGQVCSNGDCYDNTLPSPDELGLDVVANAESTLRVEIVGTDQAVERIIDQKPNRFRVRLNNASSDDGETTVPGVRDQLRLSLHEFYLLGETLKDDDLGAAFQLEQASRLRREPARAEGTYALVDADDVPIQRPEVELPWARYNLDADVAADHPLVLTIRPDETHDINGDVIRGPIHRQLVRKQLGKAATHVFEIPTRRECHRKIVGNVVVSGSDQGDAFPGTVTVEFLHTHSAPDPGSEAVCDAGTDVQAVCEPSTIYPNELPSCTTANDCPEPYGCYGSPGARTCGCARDSECRTGQICETGSNRCALDLQGLSATNGGVTTAPDKPSFDAWVYTYCDEAPGANREISYILRATPAALDDGDPMTPLPPSKLPPISFQARVNIPASDDNTVTLPGNLCFPAWMDPVDLAVDIASEPREVFRDDMDRAWVCCSPECLRQGLDAPPAVPTSCPLTGDLTARTLHTLTEAEQVADNCLGLAALDPTVEAGSQWLTGGKIQLGACVDGDSNPVPCEISLSPGGGFLEYELRLEPPVGSLVRSMRYTAVIGLDTPKLQPPAKIDYRVLLRGQVALETAEGEPSSCNGDSMLDGTDCLVRAEILAERIRLPDDDPSTVQGPFFYTARTIDGSEFGDFVLPVNPGVYLVTALPEIGAPGGPAKIAVLDLRIDSDLVDTRGEIPTATLEEPLLLSSKGQFVIIELDGFDSASVASPLDLASWTGLEFDGRPLDLNSPATCHGEPDRACSIRRLRPGNSGLALTQEQFVKFITR